MNTLIDNAYKAIGKNHCSILEISFFAFFQDSKLTLL
jgi:hypothetical protein